MAEDYRVSLKIGVYKGEPEMEVVTEEYTFAKITFAKMTHNSNEFYELITKLQKEK